MAKRGGRFRSFLHNKTILKQKIKSNNCLRKVLTTQTKKGHFWQNDLLGKYKKFRLLRAKYFTNEGKKSYKFISKMTFNK